MPASVRLGAAFAPVGDGFAAFGVYGLSTADVLVDYEGLLEDDGTWARSREAAGTAAPAPLWRERARFVELRLFDVPRRGVIEITVPGALAWQWMSAAEDREHGRLLMHLLTWRRSSHVLAHQTTTRSEATRPVGRLALGHGWSHPAPLSALCDGTAAGAQAAAASFVARHPPLPSPRLPSPRPPRDDEQDGGHR